MSIIGSNVLAGASGGAADTGYQIQRSLRFNSSDSAYLSRTPSAAGNRKTWTISLWLKRCKLGTLQSFTSSANNTILLFDAADTLSFYQSGYVRTTAQVFRDCSAWYHIVLSVDTTNATAQNRVRIYVNGNEITTWTTNTTITQDLDTNWNAVFAHQINANQAAQFGDLYLADFHNVDGQALDPTSFGEFDDNGIWQPKAYTGTYGTNGGFHLDFADNSTAAALGTDTSGNGNDWTPVNLLVDSIGGTTNVSTIASTGWVAGGAPVNMVDGNTATSYNSLNGGVAFSSPVSGEFKIQHGRGAGGLCWNEFYDSSNNLIYQSPSRNYAAGETFTMGPYYVANVSKIISQSNATGSGGDGHGTGAFYINNKIIDTNSTSPTSFAYPGFVDGDSLVDVPTNGTETDTGLGGEVVGNYATLNPLTGNTTLSNGNLDSTGKSGYNQCLSTIGMSSGKYYCEITVSDNTGFTGIGIATKAVDGSFLGNTTSGYLYYSSDGNKRTSGTNASYGSSFTTGDVIGIAFDADGGNLYFYKNGTVQNSGTAAFTGLTSGPYFFAVDQYNTSNDITANFGQRPFAYTAPSGYKALCTANLPEPTIPDGSTAMDVITWNGDTTSVANAGDRSFSSLNMSPDLVWIKQRNQAFSTGHQLYDAVRAAGSEKELNTSSTAAEGAGNIELYGWLNSFDSNGFTVRGGSTGNTYVNATGVSYVAWAWDAGANSSKTYAVTVVSDGGNKYRFDGHGTSAVTLDLEEGSTYTFDQSDSSNAGHPLRFSTTSDGTHGGGSEYTTGVTTVGTPGSAGASTTIVVASGAPTLYYYCSVHSGMGGQANTNSTAGASNFDGSIQSTVRANPSAGFSIVTFTASSSQPDTVGHGLNAKPNLIILKDRDASPRDWWTWHIGIDEDDALKLNATSGITNLSDSWSPNSSTFQVQSVASSGNDHVAYCFAPVDGYSSGFSYTGNGSTDGSFVYLGLRPRLILLKCSSTTGNWTLLDTAREGYNVDNDPLYPNLTNAEGTTDLLDITSNGFKLRTTDASVNSSGATYIGYAWAENPFKTARAR